MYALFVMSFICRGAMDRKST